MKSTINTITREPYNEMIFRTSSLPSSTTLARWSPRESFLKKRCKSGCGKCDWNDGSGKCNGCCR